MQEIRSFFVDKLFTGEINYDNNGLFRFIVIVVGIALGLLVLQNWIPRFFKMLKRKFGLLTSDRGKKYKRHAQEYMNIRTSASVYFRVFLIPTILMTIAVLGFLISTDVIAYEISFISKELLFSISFIAIIVCYVVFCVLQYIFTFTDLPDSVIPVFNDFLPPDYHTVTTTYYASSGAGYHVAGSESYTYDANLDKNIENGIGNFFSLLFAILTFLFSALFKYFDSLVCILYNLLILPFRRGHLRKAQRIYDNEMEELCRKKQPLFLHMGEDIDLDSDIYAIDTYVGYKYIKKYYTKAKETIESKENKNTVIYQKEGRIWANILTKFICEYKKQNSVCYIYESLKGIVQFEIFNNPKPISTYSYRQELEWVKETIVPINMKYNYSYKYYSISDINRVQFYYYKTILAGETNLNKKCKIISEDSNGLIVQKCTLGQIKLDKAKKTFTIESEN